MSRQAWIGRLHISRRTADKIESKHGLDPEAVRLHVEEVPGLRGSWNYHPERGMRLILKVPMDGELILVVLYPREDSEEVWNLGSAYPI